jgi:hypothetical protein
MYSKASPELIGDDRAYFWSQMHKPDLEACWLWQGVIESDGYGQVGINYSTYRTHRVAYKLYYGSDPKVVMHRPTCLRHCCNPLHLRGGTPRQNIWDGPSIHIERYRETDKRKRRWKQL